MVSVETRWTCHLFYTCGISHLVFHVRYGRVICCIGVNPNKRYDVTPETRAQILRDMISGSSVDVTCKNVQVEGTKIRNHDSYRC